MIKLSQLSRLLIFSILLVVLLFGNAVGLLFKSKLIQNFIKEQILVQTKTLLGREIQVGEVTGPLFYKVTINDIQIPDTATEPDTTMISIGSITAYYNPIVVLSKRKAPLKALREIEIDSLFLNMHRDSSGTWNILALIPKSNEPKPKKFPFTGKIRLKQSQVRIIDERGWGRDVLSAPFETSLTQLDAVLDFSEKDAIQVYLNGVHNEDEKPIGVTGKISMDDFELNLSAVDLPLEKWGPYVFPLEGYAIGGDLATVKAVISPNKNKETPTSIPIRYAVSVYTKGATLKLPFFEEPATEVISNFTISNGTNTTPEFFLSIEKLSGKLYRSKTSLSGRLDFLKNKIALEGDLKSFDLIELTNAFPALSGWTLYGKGKTHISFTGNLNAPVISGTMQSAKATFFALKSENLDIQYIFSVTPQTLDLQIRNSTLYGGVFTGGGSVQLNGKKSPDLFFNFLGQGFKFKSLLPDLDTSGTFNLQVLMSGKSNDYGVSANISNSSAKLYNQTINSGKALVNVKESKNIKVNKLHLFLNDSPNPLQLTGSLDQLDEGRFEFSGTDLKPVDIGPKYVRNNEARMSTKGKIALHDFGNFSKNPLSHIDVQLEASLTNTRVFSQLFKTITVEMSTRGPQLTFKQVRAVGTSNYSLEVTGRLQKATPTDLQIRATNFPIQEGNIVYKFLPDVLKPVTGIASGTIRLSTNLQKKTPLKIDGSVELTDTLYKEQRFSKIKTDFIWYNDKLTLNDSAIYIGESILAFNGSFHLKEGLDFTIHKGTFLKIDDFQELTKPHGLIYGSARIEGTIKGKIKNPNVDLMIDAINLETYFVRIDQLQGNIAYAKGILSSDGFSLVKLGNKYTLSGRADLNPLFSGKKISMGNLEYSVKLKTDNVGIIPFIDLISNLYDEVLYRRGMADEIPSESVANPNMTNASRTSVFAIKKLTSPSGNVILFDKKKVAHNLGYFELLQLQESQQKKPTSWTSSALFAGTMTTDIEVYSRPKKTPSIQGSISLQDAKIGQFTTTQITAVLETKNQGLHFSVTTKQGMLASTEFSKLSLTGLYGLDGTFHIENMSLATRENNNQKLIQGQIPISAIWNKKDKNKNLYLKFNFHNEDINLLTLMVPMISRIENSGDITLILSGTMTNPILDAPQLTLKNTVIHWADSALLKAPFNLTAPNVKLSNNVFSIDELEAKWEGPETKKIIGQQQNTNRLIFTGNLAIRNLDFTQLSRIYLDMDFQAKNTKLTLNYPGMYKGEIEAANLKFAGPLEIPISPKAKADHSGRLGTASESGPVLSGSLLLHDSNIELVTGKSPNMNSPSILFNLSTTLGENVSLSGSIFGKSLFLGFASGLDLALAKTTTPIRIRGSLFLPRIEEKIAIAHGSIAVLNRVFELLSPMEQKPYFQQSFYETIPNTVHFSDVVDTTTGKTQFLPILNLTALTIIDPLVLSNTPNATLNGGNQSYTPIVVRIQGPPTKLTTFAFYEYQSSSPIVRSDSLVYKNKYDLTGFGNSVQGSPDSQASSRSDVNNVIRLLLPELYLDPENSSQTELIGGALLANQLDLVLKRNLLRPVEKRIAKNMGLYDLRFNYNVGAALINANNQTQVNRIGVDAVSQLFYDNLFLRVRSDLNSSPDTNNSQQFQLSEIALTYFLLRNMSINLTNTRDENSDFNRTNFSLKVTHEF